MRLAKYRAPLSCPKKQTRYLALLPSQQAGRLPSEAAESRGYGSRPAPRESRTHAICLSIAPAGDSRRWRTQSEARTRLHPGAPTVAAGHYQQCLPSWTPVWRLILYRPPGTLRRDFERHFPYPLLPWTALRLVSTAQLFLS